MQIETSARSTGELAEGITKVSSDMIALERGQPCPRGQGCPRSGSWRASFRFFSACIGTMNRQGSPSPVLRTPSPPLGEREGVRGRFMKGPFRISSAALGPRNPRARSAGFPVCGFTGQFCPVFLRFRSLRFLYLPQSRSDGQARGADRGE